MKQKLILLCLLLIGGSLITKAQESLDASGADFVGSGGSVSYSVGQLCYTTINNGTNSLSQGVQQAFEISTLGVDNFPNLNLEIKAYPNPTNSVLFLKFENFLKNNSKYELFDTTGRLLKTGNIQNSITEIDTEHFNTGVYLLQIIEGSKNIKTFKIIKK